MGVRGGVDQLEKTSRYPVVASKAQFLGDSIHTLTPSTTLTERCGKYIDTLHPDRPDPPVQDEPYEYPFTQPLDPATVPPIKNGQNFPTVSDRDWAPPSELRIPAEMPSEYYVPRGQSRRRHRHHRTSRRDYDDDSGVADDVAKRMYRLQT